MRKLITGIKVFLAQLGLMCCLHSANAASIVVLTEAFYPMSYPRNEPERNAGSDGVEVDGFATELVRAILEEADIEYTLIMVPWARAVRTIDNLENTMVFSMARTPAREKKYHWIGDIWPMRHYLYGLRKYQDKLPTSLKDAKDFRIGVHRGDVVHEYLVGKGFENLIEVKDMKKNLFLLHRERLDLIPYVDFALGISAEKNGYKIEDLIPMIDIHEVASMMSIAMSKKTDPELVLKLKHAYQVILETGRYNEIMSPLQKMIEGTSGKLVRH